MYEIRYFTPGTFYDNTESVNDYTPERALQLARVWRDCNTVRLVGMFWVIYDRERKMIVAEADEKTGGWINPQWLIATGLIE